jgi:7-cyano-7-deazaguanine synthase
VYDAVCLASGGLDSIVCLHLLRRQGIKALPVFINYGQRNLGKELGALLRNLKSAKFPGPVIVDISGFGKIIRTGLTDRKKRVLEDAFTPNRNLLFLTVGASVAFSRGVSSVILGFLSEKTAIFPDQSDTFLAVAKDAIRESLGTELQIVCPLRDMVKSDVVSLASQLRIKGAYSCHSGTAKPCGRCIACLEYDKGG